MSQTFTDLASDSLSSIGQLGIGQSASPEQVAQAMRFFNTLIEQWSIQRFMLYTVGSSPYVLTNGQQDYTIGPSGANFTAARPTFVESAQIQLPGSTMTLPLNLLDRSKWGAIRDKGAMCSANGLPQDIWVEYSYPNLTFHMWTIPANACTVLLAAWQQLQQIVTPFDVLNFPPGYLDALRTNLAVALCPAYQMMPPPSLVAQAQSGIVEIQKINVQSIGGALGESETLVTPNLTNPPPVGGGPAPQAQQ